jgi:hypothetical protein
MADKQFERYKALRSIGGTLPTPHGRACAPWRELEDIGPRQDRGLPAEDSFAYRDGTRIWER